ncbi:hypothetical protein B0T17DRAFT_588700 [Bombardia bombarda]|uniref:Dienelactone hydrolase domain-containing protein n=1 Tax=Bombardia bombarda TaxID=252184 RepID=A0AA40C7P2_9PEZI|nr:hypothetical protein B0T17DRAFT_588700 [Bombardia bombarda]
MSTVPASHGHSEACCNVPAIVTTGYSAIGGYEEIDGIKTYATGPSDASKGIVVIYDIFGYYDQTIQGADILSASDDHQKYKVFIPDWYPPNTEEKQKKFGVFIGKNPPSSAATKLPGYIKALEAKYPSIKSWGALGFCWGGKAVEILTSGDTNPFSIAGSAHPAMVDSKVAAKIKVPYFLLASGDEPEPDVKEFEKNLTVPNHVEIFKDQVHGWMAARADLSDDHVKEEYTRGYKTVLDFFAKNWS